MCAVHTHMHSTREQRRGEIARTSHPAILHLPAPNTRRSLPHLGYAFPVYPPYPGLKVSARRSAVTTNRTITVELGVTSGPWFQEGGTHTLAWGNHRLWVLAPALQNQVLK